MFLLLLAHEKQQRPSAMECWGEDKKVRLLFFCKN
jgi:hypothetical protein